MPKFEIYQAKAIDWFSGENIGQIESLTPDPLLSFHLVQVNLDPYISQNLSANPVCSPVRNVLIMYFLHRWM